MEKINILLVCASGLSSGLMAANIRKAAKARGIDCEITARSESEIESYINDINVIMIGPHLSYLVDEVKEYEKNYDVKVLLMRADYYSTLNGDKALDHVLDTIGQ